MARRRSGTSPGESSSSRWPTRGRSAAWRSGPGGTRSPRPATKGPPDSGNPRQVARSASASSIGSRVDCLAFRPDGTMVATGGQDGMVRLWCATTGLPIGPPLAHGGRSGASSSVATAGGSRRSGPDATVRCWAVPNPVEANVERVSCWVRVLTNLEFDAGDAIRPHGRSDELGPPPPPAMTWAAPRSGRSVILAPEQADIVAKPAGDVVCYGPDRLHPGWRRGVRGCSKARSSFRRGSDQDRRSSGLLAVQG